MMAQSKISVVLLDIRSSENVGSIFRTADAAGVEKIYLAGYTPTPLDRFKRKNTKLAKAALGAEATVPWEAVSDIKQLISHLKNEGTKVIAVEQHSTSHPYIDVMHGMYPTAFVFGNEVTGIPEEILALCDSIIEIPMYGKKESLNVSVAAGIILFNTRDARMS